MPHCRRSLLFVVLAGLGCATTLGACDQCYDSGYTQEQTCEQSGGFTASVAPLFKLACPLSFRWNGTHGPSTLVIQQGCDTDDRLFVVLNLPRDVTNVSYALPSSAITIDADISPREGGARNDPNARPLLATVDGSLVVASGAVLVRSSSNYGTDGDNYGIDADVDIRFHARTGDDFAVTGHVGEASCTLKAVPYCTAD